MTKVRLDALVHRRGFADSREQARRLVMAGQVLVKGRVLDKAGRKIDVDTDIEVRQGPRYVGRGGLKLEAALASWRLDARGVAAADVGASTGGFTDCLLQHGASRVYAIDVGYGQLHWQLRQDERVIVMERTNARYLDVLPEPVQFVVMDVSFISVRMILPNVVRWLDADGHAVILVKPQFEAGAELVGRGGIIRDPATHKLVLAEVLHWAVDNGWHVWGLMRSPITGAKGNVEFLVWLRRRPGIEGNLEDLIDSIALAEGRAESSVEAERC